MRIQELSHRLCFTFLAPARPVNLSSWDDAPASDAVRQSLASAYHGVRMPHPPEVAAIPLQDSKCSGLMIHLYVHRMRYSPEFLMETAIRPLGLLQAAGLLAPFAVVGVTVHTLGGRGDSRRLVHVWALPGAAANISSITRASFLTGKHGEEFGWHHYSERTNGRRSDKTYLLGSPSGTHLTYAQYQSLMGDLANGGGARAHSMMGFVNEDSGQTVYIAGPKLLGLFQEYTGIKHVPGVLESSFQWLLRMATHIRRHSWIPNWLWWDDGKVVAAVKEFLAAQYPKSLWTSPPYVGTLPSPGNSRDWILMMHFYLSARDISSEHLWMLTFLLFNSMRSAKLLQGLAVVAARIWIYDGKNEPERLMTVHARVDSLGKTLSLQPKDLMTGRTGDEFAWYWDQDPERLLSSPTS